MPLSAELAPMLEPLRNVCERAGRRIVEHYHNQDGLQQSEKADKSPLTEADLAAHDILLEGLAFSGLPVLSEESGDEVLRQRRGWTRYWLVDPLDGTREFLDGTGEFTINIALIEEGRPRLGIVSVPLQDSVYCGEPGRGAWKYSGRGWQPIGTRPLGQEAVVLTSRRHRGDALQSCLDQLTESIGALERQYVGSALKFCLLAEGRADFYPRFSPCCEWDTAAGQALLEAAGGQLLTLQGEPLHYNQRADLYNPHFIAVADPSQPQWRKLLR